MKKFILGALICSFFLFSCQSRNAEGNKSENHNHSHNDHSHDHGSHDHDHNHDHDHDRNHDHDHDHNHDHDHELEDGQVELSKQQFERLGLQLETVGIRPFSQIIKTAGQLEAATGQEVVLSARSSGIISFANRNLTSGRAVSRGEALAYISDKNMVDGEVLNRQRILLAQVEQEYERAQ